MIDKETFERLYGLDDTKFIKEAYCTLLQREADEIGFQGKMNEIACGKRRKDIIFDILSSKESQERRIEVEDFTIDDISVNVLLDEIDDRCFIWKAYLAILGRTVDDGGMHYFLAKLQSGEMDKLDCLIMLSESPEGHNKGTYVIGLKKCRNNRKIKHTISKIPVVGRIVIYMWNLIHINRILQSNMKTVGRQIAMIESQLDNIEKHVDWQTVMLNDKENRINDMQHHINGLENHVAELMKTNKDYNELSLNQREKEVYQMLHNR